MHAFTRFVFCISTHGWHRECVGAADSHRSDAAVVAAQPPRGSEIPHVFSIIMSMFSPWYHVLNMVPSFFGFQPGWCLRAAPADAAAGTGPEGEGEGEREDTQEAPQVYPSIAHGHVPLLPCSTCHAVPIFSHPPTNPTLPSMSASSRIARRSGSEASAADHKRRDLLSVNDLSMHMFHAENIFHVHCPVTRRRRDDDRSRSPRHRLERTPQLSSMQLASARVGGQIARGVHACHHVNGHGRFPMAPPSDCFHASHHPIASMHLPSHVLPWSFDCAVGEARS